MYLIRAHLALMPRPVVSAGGASGDGGQADESGCLRLLVVGRVRWDRCAAWCFAKAESMVDPAQRAGSPPVRLPEQGHGRRNEQAADQGGVDQNGGGEGDTHLFGAEVLGPNGWVSPSPPPFWSTPPWSAACSFRRP